MSALPHIDLSAIPEDQRDAVAALMRETASLKEINKRLEHLVAELNHVVHGKKSEKLDEDDRQLAFEDLQIAVSEAEEHKQDQAPGDDTPKRKRVAEHLKASTKLFMDETTAPVLDPGRGRTKTGYLWALARDDRNWGGADPPGVVFFYAPDRGGKNAETFLRGFDGILQLDGYPGYNRLTRPSRKGGDPIRVAHCWAHARRKLKEVFDRDGVVPKARLRRDDRRRGSAPHRRDLQGRG